jgi:2-dehydro-3-deoxyglucarate aldolase/4-hydroxy-2-oxoheptanedioate aldolase
MTGTPIELAKRFSQRLRARERLVGTVVTLAAPEVAEILSASGLDWLFVDMEHAPLDPLAVQRLLAASRLPCAVRVPDGEEATLKKALDLGAAAVMVPMVNGAAQAEAVVRLCKYPPRGIRGVGIARAQSYGAGFAEYVREANAATSVIAQCEHIAAVEAIDAIARVEGLDAVLVGPYDLSGSLERLGEIDHPEVQAAIRRVRHACERAGRPLGIYVPDIERARAVLAQGYTLVAVGMDATLLGTAAAGVAKALRG